MTQENIIWERREIRFLGFVIWRGWIKKVSINSQLKDALKVENAK